MENHSGLRQKISRLLRSSSCGSCKSRTTSDVIARSETLPRTRHKYQLIDLFSPNPHPFPSIFRPKTELLSPLPKVPFPSPKCPPVSPISPLFALPKRKKSQKKRNNKSTQLLKRANSENYCNDSENDLDDENTTLFSSVPLSSDFPDSFRRNRGNCGVNGHMRRECEMGLAPLQGKVRSSFVVKKRSSNPYDDFRNSMVEMILARQIFGAIELENLLETFLSLNSYHHHGVIVQVFTEIWNALFCQNSLK